MTYIKTSFTNDVLSCYFVILTNILSGLPLVDTGSRHERGASSGVTLKDPGCKNIDILMEKTQIQFFKFTFTIIVFGVPVKISVESNGHFEAGLFVEFCLPQKKIKAGYYNTVSADLIVNGYNYETFVVCLLFIEMFQVCGSI